MKKLIYWQIKDRPNPGEFKIQFWSKHDKTDALEFNSVSLDEEKLHRKISSIIMTNNFHLCNFKE